MTKNQIDSNDARILMVVQDVSGHSENEIKWNPKDKAQVESIRQMFMTLKSQGFMFFKVKKRLGVLKTKGEHVSEFNPELKALIVEKNMDWTPVQEEVKEAEKAKWFDPEKEEIEEETKYVASQPIKGG